MKFTVADLIEQLSQKEPLGLTKLEKALGLSTKTDKEQLRIALTALTRVGLLREADDRISLVEDEGLIQARLRCSSKGFCFALRDDGGEDIYIRDNQLNHAWNGDRVLVRVTREGGRRRSPEGGVQCILQRNTTSLLAQVEKQNDSLVAVPLDDRLLTAINLPAGDSAHLKPATEAVVEVKLDRYPVGQLPPEGHVARSLAVNAGPKADLDLLLTKHSLRELPAAPKGSAKAPDLKTRDDLTEVPTLLLQLWGSADAPLLPAVSLEPMENGQRLWVHAPAIAERVGFGSALDLFLRERREALCVGDSWLPFLPSATTKAAAFKAGTPVAALSVAIDLNAEGQLEHFRFCRSTISADGLVDTKALKALADRKPKARTTPAALKELKDQLPLLEQLITLAQTLRQNRFDQGSIDLDLGIPDLEGLGELAIPEPDERRQGWMFQRDPALSTAGLLREMVLQAHRAFGRHMAALELPAIYAVNAAPEAEALNDVAKAALALEIPLELSADGNASAQELAVAFEASDRARVLLQQLRDPLKPVSLSAEAGGNNLAGEDQAYAPWCCAALHYADLWNQHLLLLLLSEGKDRPSVRHKTRVDIASDASHGVIDWPLLTASQISRVEEGLSGTLLNSLNERSRFVSELQRDAIAMAQARQAEPLVGQTLNGVISGVQSYGFFVEVPPSHVEGLVHVSSLKDDWYEYRSRQNKLVGRKNRRAYMLGDQVEVTIQKVDVLRHQIDLAVVLPEGYEELSPDVADAVDSDASSED